MNCILPNILALDVGARLLGLAVFEKRRLVFYAIKSIKKPNPADRLGHLHQILKELADSYDIQTIVLRKLIYPQQKSSFASIISAEIKSFAEENGIKLVRLEPPFIRQVICKGESVSRRNTFAIVTRLYPELSKHFAAKRIWQQTYYAYLFNAISVGVVFLKTTSENHGS